jgi:hypothetical protein
MTPVFLHTWKRDTIEESLEQMAEDFEIDVDVLKEIEIIFASYSIEWYEGDAFVLFRKDGKYYEVNGSHCSCYGLEGQWKPEEADLKELLHRVTEGDFGRSYWDDENVFADELKEVLEKLMGGGEIE